MGHRANFVIIRNGRAKAYYDQWAAKTWAYPFAEGPVAASDLSDCKPTKELLDWGEIEGGYLLDHDEKLAIGFGQGPIDNDLEQMMDKVDKDLLKVQAAFEKGPLPFFKHVAGNWPGWKLVWDERGVDVFAAHLRKRKINTIRTCPPSHPRKTSPPIELQT